MVLHDIGCAIGDYIWKKAHDLFKVVTLVVTAIIHKLPIEDLLDLNGFNCNEWVDIRLKNCHRKYTRRGVNKFKLWRQLFGIG